jgi:hypothetical protein
MGQAGQSVKYITIHSHVDGNGENRTSIETDPVDVMVIRHEVLNCSTSFRQTPFFIPSKQYHLWWSQTKRRTNGVGRTNMGLAKTRGGNLERPGIDSNLTITILLNHPLQSRYLHQSDSRTYEDRNWQNIFKANPERTSNTIRDNDTKPMDRYP